MEDLSHIALLGFLFVTIMGTAFQIAGGFGYSLIAGPFQLLYFPPELALQVLLANGLLISLLNLPQNANAVIVRVAVGAIFGGIVGAWSVRSFGAELIAFWTPVLALVTVILLALKHFNDWLPGQWQANDFTKLGTGILSGLGASWAGMPGPALIAFFILFDHPRATIIGTASVIFLISYSVALLFSVVTIGLSPQFPTIFAWSFPALVSGVGLGMLARKKITDQQMKPYLAGILFIASLTSVLLLFGGTHV